MSEMEKKICLGCMQEINADDVMCPHCGFDPNNYRVNPRCLRLGTKLAGKYIIGKVIGEGGFGITYIGWDEKLELPIAIKEFFPPKIASRDTTTGNNTIYVFDGAEEKSFEDGMRRSVKEARSMSKLEAYEGIVSIRDFFNENKTAYIIMEYVDGDTLKKYLEQNGKMSPEDVLKVMKPIMKALEQMHRTGLIHRDVSPDNIMIRRDGQVKLIDFGSARVAQEDDEKSLTIMLKRGFSPEEQYRSKGHQGAWTDIYALCATMYYMLTGKIPGTIGETSVIAILIGAMILILLGVITLRIPAAYLITFAVFMLIFGKEPMNANYLVAELCGGGLMLGAFFMATDYVTSPITPAGQIIYGICCGLLTGIFRCFGANAEGVSFAIILSNILVPIIEKFTIPRAFGLAKEAKKNE